MKLLLILILIISFSYAKEDSLKEIKEGIQARIDAKRIQLNYLEECLKSKNKKSLGLCIKQISPNDFRTIKLIKE